MHPWALSLVLCSAPATASPDGWIAVERVVAVVDDDLVLASDVEQRVALRDPAPAATPDRRAAAVQELVDELLVAHEAARRGVTVSGDDVDGAIRMIKATNNLDDAGLERALADNRMTMATYRAELERSLLRHKLVLQVVAPRVVITDEALRAAARQRGPGAEEPAALERLRSELLAQALPAEAEKWLAALRSAAHVEIRP